MHMVHRGFWISQVENAWERRSVIWLSGVRRAGKTYLCNSLPQIDYFDCELPRVRQMVADPESFLRTFRGKRVVLDEIHRLTNPSELLKIAADHYPDVRVLATGSSTLGASAKFRDTLTGRKVEIWLTPMVLADLDDFGNPDLNHRLLRGGLPPFFLEDKLPERDFQEWMDAYWAKDIQELFRLERRQSFMRFVELLIAQSGGIFEATRYAQRCEVSRPSIANYLAVMEATYLVHVVRPFSTHRPTEIVAAPKVYAFDTGFVCYHKGILRLRTEDMGMLWEHFVMNEIHGRLGTRELRYWRDKRGHEVDFIYCSRGMAPTAIECKWSAGDFDPANIKAFRRLYPEGDNYVVASDVDTPFSRRYDDTTLDFVNARHLADRLAAA
jgi:predicted AAA+ superfamily ATPase